MPTPNRELVASRHLSVDLACLSRRSTVPVYTPINSKRHLQHLGPLTFFFDISRETVLLLSYSDPLPA